MFMDLFLLPVQIYKKRLIPVLIEYLALAFGFWRASVSAEFAGLARAAVGGEET